MTPRITSPQPFIVVAFLVCALLAGLPPFGRVGACRAETMMTVSAAASLTDAFRDIKARYLKDRPGVQIALNFAGSGVLKTQITRGAPVDVFAAAGMAPIDLLIGEGLVDSSEVAVFASNRLVLIYPANAEHPVRYLRDLARPEVRRIAMGNEKTTPVGAYAWRAIRHHDLHLHISEKLVRAESTRAVLEYVAKGLVDAGFVYATDVRIDLPVAYGGEVPPRSYGPILLPIAPIATSEHPEEAREFVRFVLGPIGREVMYSYGFLPPPAAAP